VFLDLHNQAAFVYPRAYNRTLSHVVVVINTSLVEAEPRRTVFRS